MNIKAILLCGLLLLASSPSVQSQDTPQKLKNIIPPTPIREFRAVWIATVVNIDFPSKPGLTTDQQKAEMIAQLDRAVELKLNAVIFQVRPMCDALYASPYEPWSEFITKEMGKAPEPDYDPLAFAVQEAHKRSLELHAWFNPYRAHHPKATSPISPNHISKTRPELVKQYGKYLWLDPGEKEVQDYSLKVIMDVVRRYDIDGVHIDDYFYPYPERNEQNQIIDFPDDSSWQKYLASGGKKSRNDWRRENINTFVRRLYESVKAQKSWLKVGISPFGIWKPGYPKQTTNKDNGKTFDAYNQIYADSRKWLVKGWLDYLSPQLYWKIEQTQQSYPVLLNWWLEQNTLKRHIFPGIYTSRVANDNSKGWNAQEIVYQIRVTRGFAGAGGNVHFSMKPLMQNRGGISDLLPKEVYNNPALVPASPWLNKILPGKPVLSISKDKISGNFQLNWKPTGREKVWLWVVQTKTGSEWTTNILPASQNSYSLNNTQVESVAVSGVTRFGMQGGSAVVEVYEE
ncbi:MAG: glycoside hydrolase family 10 protein [Heteroscytonema crispum UTEX LB 1556]